MSPIDNIINEFDGWGPACDDPWDKRPLFDIRDADWILPGSGVYAFVNKEKKDIYYIGKAAELRGRLTRKLSDDYGDQRTKRAELSDGRIDHEYPYLLEYQTYTTRVYTKVISDNSNVESALLASYRLSNNRDLPLANRHPQGSTAMLDNPDFRHTLKMIWDGILAPLIDEV